MIDDKRLKLPEERAIREFFDKTKPYGVPIMICQTGSHAYGLNTATSDEDWRGVFIPNLDYLLGLKTVEQVKVKDDNWICHDIRQFVKIALKQNPTILEMLFIEPIYSTQIWNHLCLELRATIRKSAFIPYSAYIRSQLHKGKARNPIGKRKEGVEASGYDKKFTSHVARLAVQCIGLMRDGIIPVKVPEPYRTAIISIKSGDVAKEDAFAYCEALDIQMYREYQSSKLPENFNINKFEEEIYLPLMLKLVEMSRSRAIL